MLEIKKAALSLEEGDVLELERIVTDSDAEAALAFLKRSIYNRVLASQQGRLKSHLDAANPVQGFIQQGH